QPPVPNKEIEHPSAISGKARSGSIPFGDDRARAGRVVNPDVAPAHADRRHERPAVRRHGNAFFLERAESDLFGGSVRKPLPPEGGGAANDRAEVHPASVWGPGR